MPTAADWIQLGLLSCNGQSITIICLLQLCFGCRVSPPLNSVASVPLASPPPTFPRSSSPHFSHTPNSRVSHPTNTSSLVTDWHQLCVTPSLSSPSSPLRTRNERQAAAAICRRIKSNPAWQAYPLMTLCATAKFINTNRALIDARKWHHSYAALRRSMWLHRGLLDKQAIFYSLMSVWWCVRQRWEMREAREHGTCGCLWGEGGCSILGTGVATNKYASMHTHTKHHKYAETFISSAIFILIR